MARDGGKIEIKIGADASELEQELSRASKALASTTTDAAKMGDTVDNVADDMKASAKKMGDLSSSAENTKDEFGELSSGMGALATALDMVDPRLGAAARGMGDLAGASEGAIKLTRLQSGALSGLLPKVGLVGAAVAALGATYLILKRSADKASQAFQDQADRAEALRPLISLLSEATLKHAVASDVMTAAQANAIRTGRALDEQFAEQRTTLVQNLSEESLRLERLEARYATYHRGLVQLKMRTEDLTEAEAERAALEVLGDQQSRETIENQRTKIAGMQAEFDSINNTISTVRTLGVETEAATEASAAEAKALADAAAGAGAAAPPVETLADRYQTFAENVGKAVEALEGLTRSNADTMAAMRAQGDAVAENTRKEELAVRASRDNAQKRIDILRSTAEEAIALAGDDAAERETIEVQLASTIMGITAGNAADVSEIRRHHADLERDLIDGQVEAFERGERARTDAADREATKRRDQKFADYQSDLSMAQEVTGQLADLGQARLDLFLQNAGRMTAITKAEADNMTEAERQAANAQIALNRDAALKMWRQNKALAIAEAAQLALEASLRAFAQNAANPIYAGIVSGLAFAIATAKGAMIASSPPPFKEGGMVPGVGAVPITAHGGEGVLTEQTTRAIGGKAGIDALNRGDIGGQLQTLISLTERQAAGTNNGSQVIEMRYKHKVLDTVIKDQLRSGTALKRALRGRSRIGHS